MTYCPDGLVCDTRGSCPWINVTKPDDNEYHWVNTVNGRRETTHMIAHRDPCPFPQFRLW